MGVTSRRAAALIAFSVTLLGTGFGPPQFLASDAAQLGLRPTDVRALQSYKSPVVTARAAVLLDAATGAVLYAKNGDERLQPASLTKIMTALVAMERGRLDQRITATEHVYVEPVVIGVDPGEVLSLEDLLYGLLVWSGNDAAVDIAEGLAGTMPQFANWMNEKAAAMGLRNTHFITPHGLDVPGHYSSAEDMARLLAALMREPVLARMVGAREYTIPGPPLYKFRNSNPLLGAYDGVDGGKTGLTDGCGRCLAVTAVRGGHRVVAVVLGSQDIARDGRILLDFAFSNYEWTPVGAYRSTPPARRGDERIDARAVADAALVFPAWESRDVPTRVVSEADAAPGRPAGRLIVESALRPLGEFPLMAPEQAPEPPMEERLQKVLAHAGVASRREAERLVLDGRVTVNGEVIRALGSRVDPLRDSVAVDGRAIRRAHTHTYLALHKPRGYVSTLRDDQARRTVRDLVRAGSGKQGSRERVYPVGRLDVDSEGLLLLTDDGDLTLHLTHPRYGVPKEYRALVRGSPDAVALMRLRRGVDLEEGRTAPAEVDLVSQDGDRSWVRIVLKQGWKRQVRRMLAAVGHQVERLVRVRVGSLELDGLPVGAVRLLTPVEVARLRRESGLAATEAGGDDAS